MMFTEAIDCALACTSLVWNSVAPLAIALYFAYLLYTVAAPPAGPAPVEKDTKTASASPDDVSTDAGESDSEGSSQEGSDESISVRAGADDDTSSCADVCLDAVSWLEPSESDSPASVETSSGEAEAVLVSF